MLTQKLVKLKEFDMDDFLENCIKYQITNMYLSN